MPSKFLQIHTLTSYPATLLNRDDAGFAKRLPFGGATRLRVSSQCLKRHWRRSESDYALGQIPYGESTAPLTVRSRLTFHRKIYEPLQEEGVPEDTAYAVAEALIDALLGKSKKRVAKAADKEGQAKEIEEALETGQVTVLGRPEVKWLQDLARGILSEHQEPKAIAKAVKDHFKKDAKKNLDQLRSQLGMGLDAALFGRMVTSDILARLDAAVHVAHAFTVHAAEVEPDYFSAVDDIREAEGQLGSGHINTVELTSGLYYGYVVIDVPLLVSNLEGCDRGAWLDADVKRSLAAEVVRRFIQLVATTTPGAKLGSTAPYSVAQMMLVEAGAEAPRTLANAFAEPVRPSGQIISDTYQRLAAHLADLDQAYGAPEDGRKALALGPKEKLGLGEFVNLRQLAEWGAERVA